MLLVFVELVVLVAVVGFVAARSLIFFLLSDLSPLLLGLLSLLSDLFFLAWDFSWRHSQ